MDLQTVLMVISVVILSIITIILIGLIAAVLLIRKKVKQIPVAKFGGLMSLVSILKFVLGRRQMTRH